MTAPLMLCLCLALVVVFQQCLCATVPDPCNPNVYSLLRYEKRVVSYTAGPTETEECDHYLHKGSNWYKIDGGGSSNPVTTCPDIGQCGTLFPIWLNGSLPTTSDGIVSRTACQRGITGCCEKEISIRLKNCGSFMVSYLKELPGCPGKYCFEYKEKCPPGQRSETGFMPCSSNYPKLPGNAEAVVEPFIKSHDFASPDFGLFFRCKRSYDNSRSNYYFDVHWYIDGQKVKHIANIPYSKYSTDAVIKEESTWRLPMMVNCSYTARLFKNGVPSPPVMSDEFFAGIKFHSAAITWTNTYYAMLKSYQEGAIHVKEGQTVNIQITSTIPVPCVTDINGRPRIDDCIITFENNAANPTSSGCHLNGATGGNLYLGHGCGFKFNGNQMHWNRIQTMPITANSNGHTGPSTTAVIRLSSPVYAFYPLWSNYKLAEIKVLSEDANQDMLGHVCRAFTDVHYKTFDGPNYSQSSYQFSSNNPGWYLLYRHIIKPIEVMTITEAGFSSETVQCAVSVKAGSDVFMVYLCKKSWIIKRLGCEHGNNLEVYEKLKGKLFLVILPTGTKVEIQIYTYSGKTYLQLNIFPAPEDTGKTEGLCGDFDGNADTGLNANRWRLGDTVRSDDFTKGTNASFTAPDHICLCKSPGKAAPSMAISGVYCDWRTSATCTRRQWDEKPCHFLQKRDAHLNEDVWTFNSSDQNHLYVQRRVARSTWTETTARTKCLDVFRQYRSFNKCVELPDVDVDTVLSGCALDVISSGTTDWIPGALEMVKSQCINVLDVDTSLWITAAPGVPSVGETIFEEAKCPSECHGHGHCVKGVCKCDSGFKEEDCSVDLSIPPKVTRLSRNGICDLSLQNTSCLQTHVYGYNFYDSPSLICRLREIIVSNAGVRIDTTSVQQNAVFENFGQITCTFPEKKRMTFPRNEVAIHGYRVEVSNNGVIYSSVLSFIARDPKCHDCDMKSMKCKLKEKSCYIDGTCYTEGEAKQSQPHMKCTPTVSGFTWTEELVAMDNVRLVGGQSNLEGRVELLHNGIWGTVCDFYFDDIDATVICKMLGYNPTPGKSKVIKKFGGGSGPIWFDDPECNGSERDIADCPRVFGVKRWGIQHCHHNEDAGVRCTPRQQNPAIVG